MTRIAEELAQLAPADLRRLIAAGEWTGSTRGFAQGHVQANLAIVPEAYAADFLLFCTRNPKPCPLLEVIEAGSFTSQLLAPGADIRREIPRYRVYEHGLLRDEPTDVSPDWPDDAVTFLFGCSLTFEDALQTAGVPLRHIEDDTPIPVYITNHECRPAGPFAGPLVVTMRQIPGHLVPTVVQLTARYPSGHGAPIHVSAPEALGIEDLDDVYAGQPPTLGPGEVPVFWACGVTPQLAISAEEIPYVITHYPEHMFVTDWVADAFEAKSALTAPIR